MFLNIFNDLGEKLKNNAYNIVLTAIIVLIAIVLLLILKFITLRVKRGKNKRIYTVVKIIESIMKYIIVLVVIFIILDIWGFDVTAALIGVAIVVLVIGLGSQELIKDIIAGISIVIEEQYDLDEIVEINGFKGKVLEIGLRTTKLINYLGEIRIIRNGTIKEVSNYSRTFSVATAIVTIDYKENVDKVVTLLDEILPSLKDNYPQIIEGPIVSGVEQLTEKGIDIKITAKTESEEHYSVQRALLKKINEVFEEHNIQIPYKK